MFDLGFSELIVCFVIALVVLGPKRMSELTKKVGRWVGKARSMARQFREQLETEINLDDLERTTTRRAQESQPTTSVTESPGETPAATTTTEETQPDNLASSGYPYGTPTEITSEATPEPAPATGPQPGDDTYSHAHGTGEAPQPDTSGPSAEPDSRKEDPPAT